MRIDTEKCIGCGVCIDYCPMSCIVQENDIVKIIEDECVECGVCLKMEKCPTQALFYPEETYVYPRAIRMQFSDPSAQHPNFKSWGRGTEEAKTNDVTGKFSRGKFGMLFEFGRPVTGTRFSEIEKVTRALGEMGVELLEDNPVAGLLDDGKKGTIKKEYLNEKILSGIVEVSIDESQLDEVIERIFPIFDTLETVVSVGLVSRFDEKLELPVVEKLKARGIEVRPNAKINVGLGRPLID